MKKILSFLLTFTAIFLYGCGAAQTNAPDPAIELCLSSAQELIDNGDLDGAVAILEEGLASTNAPSIQALLDEVIAMKEVASPETSAPTDIGEPTSNTAPTQTVDEPVELSPLEYWVEYCDVQYLEESDLYDLSEEECRIARNAIYAKSGRIFNDTALTKYYLAYDWYYPVIAAGDFSDDLLSEIQLHNLDVIIQYEAAGNSTGSKDYASYAGTWGDLILEDRGNYMEVGFSTVQAGSYREASLVEKFYYSQIKNDSVRIYFTDSWGNKGWMTLTFGKNAILVDITDVELGNGALWGIFEGSFTVTRDGVDGTVQDYQTNHEGYYCNEIAWLFVVRNTKSYEITLGIENKTVEFTKTVDPRYNSGSIFRVNIQDDGFGGSGTLVIEFLGNDACCTVENLKDTSGDCLLTYFDNVALTYDNE